MRFQVGSVTPNQVTGYYQTSARISRAEHITGIKQVAPLFWTVPSQTTPNLEYQVYRDEKGWHCDCDDMRIQSARNPKHRCKHALACEITVRETLNQ